MQDKRIDEMFGRFRLRYDYDTDSIWFSTRWNDNHEQRRTVTPEQAEVIKNILMGGHVNT